MVSTFYRTLGFILFFRILHLHLDLLFYFPLIHFFLDLPALGLLILSILFLAHFGDSLNFFVPSIVSALVNFMGNILFYVFFFVFFTLKIDIFFGFCLQFLRSAVIFIHYVFFGLFFFVEKK